MKAPQLSIIVPVDQSLILRDCLHRALQAIDGQPIELIVVENGGLPHTLQELTQCQHSQLRIIHTHKRNAAHARNVGARAAQSEWLLFMDADIVIDHAFICVLMKHLTDRLFPCIVFPIIPMDHPNDEVFLTQYRRKIKRVLTQESFVTAFDKFNGHKGIAVLNSACMAITTIAFNRVGGFDDSLARLEDLEFSIRAWRLRLNCKAVLASAAYVVWGKGFWCYLKRSYVDGKVMPEVSLLTPMQNIAHILRWYQDEFSISENLISLLLALSKLSGFMSTQIKKSPYVPLLSFEMGKNLDLILHLTSHHQKPTAKDGGCQLMCVAHDQHEEIKIRSAFVQEMAHSWSGPR